MKKLNNVMIDISSLLLDIETNYPELYQFLDETPISIPSKTNTNLSEVVMTEVAMTEYLEDLKELLRHHLESHKKDKN